MTGTYLTRSQVAERYPISVHTLAKLASQGKGPRFYKPTDKCLYRPEDIEAWIESAAVLPVIVAQANAASGHHPKPMAPQQGRGKTTPTPPIKPIDPSHMRGRKSLPPSANSRLRKTD